MESALAAPVAVVDDTGGSTLRERHVECREHQLGLQVRVHHPTDNASRPDVEHDRQVQESSPGRDVRDVGDPQPIRARRHELPLDPIDRALGRRIHLRGSHKACRIHATQPGRAHQPRHAFTSDVQSVLVGELGVDRRCAIRAT
jgi:hypothetical protein